MKKSKIVNLVLVSSVLVSCSKQVEKEKTQKVYMRSDSTAHYTQIHNSHPGIWYYAFRPYGYYHGSSYYHGHYSNSLHESSNLGNNHSKTTAINTGKIYNSHLSNHNSSHGGVSRGGFGGSHSSVHS